MKQNINVPVQQMLEECTKQTSFDLMSMRARGVETADAVYDDWVMTGDVYPLIYPLLEEYAADMSFILRTMVETYEVDTEDHISYVLNISKEMEDTSAVDHEAMAYFKYRVLAWWYHYRDAELSTSYATKAEAALNNVFTLCIPRTGTLVGRHY